MRDYLPQWRKDNPEKEKAYAATSNRNYRNTENGKAVRAKAERKRYWKTRELANKKRQARKHGLTLEEVGLILSKECSWCGSTEDLQIDHKHPVSKGGSSALGNLHSLCGGCNKFKGSRLVTDSEFPGVVIGR